MKKSNCIILTPDRLLRYPCDELPIIFLAGPATNAPNWHSDAIAYFMEKNLKVIIVTPKSKLAPLVEIRIAHQTGEGEPFQADLEWQEFYLQKAALGNKGCLMFWLAGEKEFCSRHDKYNPRDLPQREDPLKAYAFMTQYQLGRWGAKAGKENLVIGSDGGYPELKSVLFDIAQERPNLQICPNLAETCEAALAVATRVS
jgi:hypothetical protein